VGTDFAGHAGHFGGERPQLIDHRIDGVLQLEDLPLHIDGDLARQVAAGDGLGDVGDIPHLAGQVTGHEVHRVGEVLPRAGHAFYLARPSSLPVGTDFAGHAGDFRGKGVELVDHRVDGVLELEDFAFDIDGDLLGKVAVGD